MNRLAELNEDKFQTLILTNKVKHENQMNNCFLPKNKTATSGNYILGLVVHKVLLMVSLIGAALLMNGCGGQQALMAAHNSIVKLERAYVFEGQKADQQDSEEESQKVILKACNIFHEGLLKLDITGCPDDYKQAVTDLINVVGDVKRSVADDDLGKFAELNQKRMSVTLKLNNIAESHGLQIQR